ncbi:MAG: Hsp33 family molecular chaperone HslO [Tissierellia bacterium]|nr:Hsp33 family molecular chaperone HslO [Tissierellia bacterium]
MKDYLIRAINPNNRVRVMVARTTATVEEFRNTHGASATSTAAMGRLLTASAMIAAPMKNESDIATFIINGGGPIGRMVTVADSKGNVKGYCENPEADLPDRDGHLDVGGIVGTNGYLQVIQDLGLKEPYSGQVELVNGEIGMDFAQYFYTSEQIESVVSLGVLVDTDLTVKGSGGFIIQLMPDATEEDIVAVEKAVHKLEPVSSMISRGVTPEEIAEIMLAPLELTVLETTDIAYHCDCSLEKMERALISLGKRDLEEIIKEDGKAELVCQFCNSKHMFDEDKLRELMDIDSKEE